jgi:hypothetical protein
VFLTRFLYREVTSRSIYRTNQKRFLNAGNFKAIEKLAWHLAAAPGNFCVERTPEGARAPALLCVNMANPAIPGFISVPGL